ncbi:glycoside hydrolase family 2 protein [Candidatus Xianfuyuplasma coldseepsis]|uniref:Glycoside hydrolase family 2 protein n=1 Tax=Candidatus Xianfuyuplasma coldseepsis TaxID=2782163 RepID=A0A7L7KPI7_9MOLU|nr:glycoside hydrolase family 2 TIM barrel-domain containing protein [Xianfuyuplasma coldseepsis]QMS84349.1 glycoside hydrolase family 2 protein [Xianfuyuplasma coldseepsis]
MGKELIHTTFLNDHWTYVPSFEESFVSQFPEGEMVHIPHTNTVLPLNNFSEKEYQFISAYHNQFTLSKKRQKRYILHFEGVMNSCDVYVNKTHVCTHQGGYTAFHVDVTAQLKSGENEIVVRVDSRESNNIPPYGNVVDFLTYGGIYREVYLEEQPQNYIEYALIDVVDDQLQVRLLLDVKQAKDTVFAFNIYKDKQLVYFFEREYNLQKNDIIVKEKVYLDEWSLEEPHLYELEIVVEEEVVYRSTFANRTAVFATNGFSLNNTPIKLVGLNRHQAYPYVGYAMPSTEQKRDAEMLKERLGVNIVRSSHYPPSRHFLDRCDELGLLVFCEIPGWQYIGDDQWKQQVEQDVRDMILHHYNHPSIIIWGVRINESGDDHELYTTTNQIAKELDPYRATGGVRNFAKSEFLEDVYTYNDFVHHGDNQGLEQPHKITKKSHPYLVTEYNGHMFPTKSFDDEAHRIEHVKRHLTVQEANFSNVHISGAIGWCMNDYNTHKDFGSGDRVCYHGVMDMFRIEKDAAYVYASIGRKEPFMHITSALHIGDREASEIKEVMILTNLDLIKFYINDEYIGEYTPSHEYKALPHPPIIIDDFIGQLIHEHESFSAKDADTIKSILLYIMKHGFRLPLRKKLQMAWVMYKYKLSYAQAAKLYETYVGKWGLESLTYRFDGYNDQLLVVSKTVGTSHEEILDVTVDNSTITESSTYETSRIVVRHMDHHGTIKRYSNEVLQLSTNGPIEIIGPKLVPLTGGVLAIYVKSMLQKGEGTLHISSARFKTKSVNITII